MDLMSPMFHLPQGRDPVKLNDPGQESRLQSSPCVKCPGGSRIRNFRFNLIAPVCFSTATSHGLLCGRSQSHKYPLKS